MSAAADVLAELVPIVAPDLATWRPPAEAAVTFADWFGDTLQALVARRPADAPAAASDTVPAPKRARRAGYREPYRPPAPLLAQATPMERAQVRRRLVHLGLLVKP